LFLEFISHLSSTSTEKREIILGDQPSVIGHFPSNASFSATGSRPITNLNFPQQHFGMCKIINDWPKKFGVVSGYGEKG
jgi:hypothetical protein